MGSFNQGNWGIKLLSLLLAVVMWVYVTNELNPFKEQEFRGLPVEIRGLKPNLAVSELPGNVSIRVQANQDLLANLSPRAIEVFVDLTEVKPGRVTLPVQVKVPAGIRVTDLRPQETALTLDTLIEKQVPVKVRPEGQPLEGYKVLDIKTKPDEIILKGPKSIIDNVDSAEVDIQLRERTKTFSGTMPVKISDGGGNFLEERLVRGTPSSVEVLVSVVPDTPSKTVRVVPGITGQPAPGFAVTMITVEPDELVITGDINKISGTNEVFTETLDINGATDDIYVDSEVGLPAGVFANRQTVKLLVKVGND